MIDTLVLPCGGGGLLAGAALALRSRQRNCRLVAVEPSGLPSLAAALERGRPVRLPPRTTVAGGIAVREVGRIPLRILLPESPVVVTVEDWQILDAIRFLALETKQVVEGAGATAVAALLAHPHLLHGSRHVGIVLTGGNLDPVVLERALSRSRTTGNREP